MHSVIAKPYRIGVIGAGQVGLAMMRRIFENPKCELVGVADQSFDALQNIKDLYPAAALTDNALAFARTADVDAMFVASPPSTHTIYAGESLNSNRHVLVNPPIAGDIRAANALGEFARAKGLVLMVASTSMYRPEVTYVRDLVEENQIGNILYVDSEISSVGNSTDLGVLWNQAPEALSPILYWIDELPMAVEAVARSYSSEDRDDAVFMTLHLASGVVIQIRLSSLAPIDSHRTTVTGSKAMVILDDASNADALRIYRRDVETVPGKPALFGNVSSRASEIEIPQISTDDVLESELDHFIHCIQYDQKPRSSARTGVWNVAIIEAAQRALQSGHRERIDYPPVKAAVKIQSARRFVQDVPSV